MGKGLVKALRSGGCVDDYLQDQVGEEGRRERGWCGANAKSECFSEQLFFPLPRW